MKKIPVVNEQLSGVWRRFGAAVVVCLLLAALLILDGTLPFNVKDEILSAHTVGDWLYMLNNACWIGLILSTAASVLPTPRWMPWICALAGCAAGLLWADTPRVLFGLGIAGVSLCFHGVCRGKEQPRRLGQVIGWFLTCCAVTLAVVLALLLCSSAIRALFDVDWISDLENALLSICCLVLAPCLFFSGVPDAQTPPEQRGGFRRMVSTLLLPIYLLLLAVLLGYIGKILVTAQMPVGQMNGYALLALTLFMGFHLLLTGEENHLSALFVRWGAWLLVPVILTQQYGVWVRVSAYGWTTSRILGQTVTLLGMAVVLSALIRRRASWFFPAAAVLALAITCTPLNADNLSRIDQENRLLAALRRSDMLTETQQIRPGKNVSPEDRAIILSALEFLRWEVEDPAPFTLTAAWNRQLDEAREANRTWKDVLGFAVEDDAPVYTARSFYGASTATQVEVRGFAHARWIFLSADIDAQALTVSLHDQTIDVQPLVESARDNALTICRLPLEDGSVLDVSKIRVEALDGVVTDVSLQGWLLTPETE